MAMKMTAVNRMQLRRKKTVSNIGKPFFSIKDYGIFLKGTKDVVIFIKKNHDVHKRRDKIAFSYPKSLQTEVDSRVSVYEIEDYDKVLLDNFRLLMRNIDTINKFSEYKQGWDGYKGMEFTKDAISQFKNVVISLKKQPRLAPTGRNSIVLEYRNGKKRLYFELFADKLNCVYIVSNNYNKAMTAEFNEMFDENINFLVKKYGF